MLGFCCCCVMAFEERYTYMDSRIDVEKIRTVGPANETEGLAITGEGGGFPQALPRQTGASRIVGNLPAVPRFSDPAQRRAGLNIVKFLALLLVLTLIARGTSGATLARVDLSNISRSEIVDAVTGSATVSAKDTVDIFAPEGLTILEILAGTGQTVNTGDAVARFDPAEIEKALARESVNLDKLLLDLRRLERTEATDTSSVDNARRSLRRAQEDYNAARNQADSDVSAAKKALDEALAELADDPDATALETATRNLTRAQEDCQTVIAQGDADIKSAQDKLTKALDAKPEPVDTTARDNALRNLMRAEDDYHIAASQGSADISAAQRSHQNAIQNESDKKADLDDAVASNADPAVIAAAMQAYDAARTETVKARDALTTAQNRASDNLASAHRKIEDAQVSLTQAENNYDRSAKQAADAIQNDIDRARDDLAATEKKAADNLLSSARRVEDAEFSLAQAENNFEKSAMQAADAKQTNIDRARDALDTAQKKAADNLQSAFRRVEDAEVSLLKSEQDYNKSIEQSAETTYSNSVSAVALRLDIDNQKTVVDALNMLAVNDGVLYADITGVVSAIKAEGSVTGRDALVAFMDGAKGFEANLQIAKSDADKLAVGDECQVTTGGGSMYYNPTVTGTVSAISQPDEQDRVRITVRLPEGNWTEGQRVDIQAVQDRSTYDMCVPLSALRSDNTGYYLYTVEQQSTILGIENKVIRVPVNLIASDDNMAAIQGPVNRNSQIITGSSKPVSAGDRVRMNG